MRRSWVLAVALVCLFAWRGERPAWGADSEEFAVPPPPLSEDYYPCAENCHNDMDTDPTPRELEDEHDDVELHHAEQFRWCLDCHDADDRDKLHLQSGEKLDFEHSYRLCGQCHGPQFRDWREGIHGKRTGFWDGKKQYLLCAHCHNPHSPKFESVKPEPPPQVPIYGTAGGHGEAAGHGEPKGH